MNSNKQLIDQHEEMIESLPKFRVELKKINGKTIYIHKDENNNMIKFEHPDGYWKKIQLRPKQ